MFSTFNIYLSKRFMFWAIVIIGVVAAVIGLFEFIELLRKTMTRPHIRTSALLELMILKIPQHIQNFFPFICMLTAQITFWRLNQDQEIIAIRSLGVSVFQLISSIIVCTIILGVMQLSILNPLSAVMNRRSLNIEAVLFNNKSENDQLFISSDGLWLREKFEGSAKIFQIEKYNIEQKDFQNIHVFETDEDGLLSKRLLIEKGVLEDNAWHFTNVQAFDEKESETKKHDTYIMPTKLSIKKIQESNAPVETISIFNLVSFIKNMEHSGLSTIKYELYRYSVLAKIPLAIALIILSAAFCLHPTRYKKTSILILMGVLTGFILHFMSDIIYALGLAQKIPLSMAAFAPVFITLFFSLGLIMHVEQG